MLIPSHKDTATLRRMLASVWPKINAAGCSIASTQETHRNYFAWCVRRNYNPQDWVSFNTYFGLYNEDRGKIRTRGLSLALLEQRFGRGCGGGPLSSAPSTDSWRLSLVAQCVDLHDVPAEKQEEAVRDRHELYPTKRTTVRIEATIPEPVKIYAWAPRDFNKVDITFSAAIKLPWGCQHQCRCEIKVNTHSTLDTVLHDICVAALGPEFVSRPANKTKKIFTTVQPYKYRPKKLIKRCLEFEREAGKFRRTADYF